MYEGDYYQGDVVWANLNNNLGNKDENELLVLNCEQQGVRPAIIVQNNLGNKNSKTTLIVPLTSSSNKHDLPVHVHILKTEFISTKKLKNSIALCEQVRVISRERIVSKEGRITSEVMEKIVKALLASLGYGEQRQLKMVWILLKEGIGSEQVSENPMPALLVQNQIGNINSPTTIIAPITRRKRKKLLPTQVIIPGEQVGENFEDSVLLCEQVRVIDKQRITHINQEVNLSDEVSRKVEKALLISFGIQLK